MKQVSLTRAQLDFPARLDLGLALQTMKTPIWGNPTGTYVKFGKSSWGPARPDPIFSHGPFITKIYSTIHKRLFFRRKEFCLRCFRYEIGL